MLISTAKFGAQRSPFCAEDLRPSLNFFGKTDECMNALQRALTEFLECRDHIAAFHACKFLRKEASLCQLCFTRVISAVNQASFALVTLNPGQCQYQRHVSLVRDTHILRSEQLLPCQLIAVTGYAAPACGMLLESGAQSQVQMRPRTRSTLAGLNAAGYQGDRRLPSH